MLLRTILPSYGGEAGAGQGRAEGAHRSGTREAGLEGGQPGEEDQRTDLGTDSMRSGGTVQVRREVLAHSAMSATRR